LKVARGGI